MKARRIPKTALRSERTSITLTKAEREWLDERAEAGGMSLTDYLLHPHRLRMRAEATGDLVLDSQGVDKLLSYIGSLEKVLKLTEEKVTALEDQFSKSHVSDEETADRANRRVGKAGRIA